MALGFGVILWIALSMIAGFFAESRGRSPGLFILISFVLSPLVGILSALAVKKDNHALDKEALESGLNKKCPLCAEVVKSEAKVCKHCGRELPPLSDPSPAA